MAASGVLSTEEEFAEVKKKVEAAEKKVDAAEKKVEAAEKKLDKLVEGRSEEEYTNDPRYESAKEDLACEKVNLAGVRRILAALYEEKNLLRSQGGAGPGPSSAAAGFRGPHTLTATAPSMPGTEVASDDEESMSWGQLLQRVFTSRPRHNKAD